MTYVMHRISAENTLLDGLPCAKCGTDLAGCNPSGQCPQCGEPINQSLIGHAVCRVDENEMLAEEVRCRGDGCEYTLRGIDPLGDCPECHTPVAYSLEVDLLRYASPAWIRTVATGITWYFIGMILVLLMIPAMIVIGALARQDRSLSILVGVCFGTLIGIVNVVAVFLMTARDPDASRRQQDSPFSSGTLARLLFILSVLLAIPNAYLSMKHPQSAQLTQSFTQLFGAIAYFALFTHIQKLLYKVPDDARSRTVGIIKWLWVAASIVGVAGVVLLAYSGINQMAQSAASGGGGQGGNPQMATGSMALMAGGSILGCVGGLAYLVCMIWIVVVLHKMRKTYVRAATIALAG